MEALNCICDTEYVITNSKNNLFLRLDPFGKYTIVSDIKKALKFSQVTKAKNVIANSISKDEQTKWSAKSINDISNIPKISDSSLKFLDVEEVYSYNEKVTQKVQEIYNLLEDLHKNDETINLYIEKMNREQSRIDTMISDVYHFIAFEKVDAIKRQKVYNVLKTLLQQRAKIKENYRKLFYAQNKQEDIETFKKYIECIIRTNEPYSPRTEIYDALLDI